MLIIAPSKRYREVTAWGWYPLPLRYLNMRLPLTPPLSTKDGVSAKNARLTNCLKESKKTGDKAVIRPGLVLDAQASGVGNGLVSFNGELVSVYGATLGVSVNSAELLFSYDGVLGTTPTSAWNGIAWNGSKYCVVGTRSSTVTDKCAVSSDGLSWTEKTLPISAIWSGITSHNGNLVAVGYVSGVAGYSAVSADNGDSWTLGTISVSGIFWGVPISANGLVCVMNQVSGLAAISADGLTWNTYTATGCGSRVAWNGTVFCSPGSARPIYSTDGQTWSNGTAWSGSAANVIASNGESFVAGVEFSGDIQTSSDGITFTLHSSVLSSFPTHYWQDISFIEWGYLRTAVEGFGGSGRYYATSIDGVSWDEFSFSPDGYWTSLCRGNLSEVCVISGAEATPKSTLMEYTYVGSIPALTTITGTSFDFAQSPL